MPLSIDPFGSATYGQVRPGKSRLQMLGLHSGGGEGLTPSYAPGTGYNRSIPGNKPLIHSQPPVVNGKLPNRLTPKGGGHDLGGGGGTPGVGRPAGGWLNATGGPSSGSTGMFGGTTSQVTTGTRPSGIYEPWMTTAAANIASADADRVANLDYLQKGTDAPGRSRDAGTAAVAMQPMAMARTAARQAQAEIPLADEFANAQNQLRGELLQDREGLGYGNLSARLFGGQQQAFNANRSLGLQRAGTGMNLIDALFGAGG